MCEMPKKPIDFSKAVIYKIVCKEENSLGTGRSQAITRYREEAIS